MSKINIGFLFLIFPLTLLYSCNDTDTSESYSSQTPISTIKLPSPSISGEKSLEQCLIERQSTREYTKSPLTIGEISQLLWAGQGITREWGGRTSPSAGGLYPLEIYIVAGNAAGLDSGIYKYKPDEHELIQIATGDIRKELSDAVLSQQWVEDGAVSFVITAVYERTTEKYGDRGITYVHMEAGHAAQNICLQATSLDLGIVTVGAFHDNQVKELLKMNKEEIPLYVIPVGKLE